MGVDGVILVLQALQGRCSELEEDQIEVCRRRWLLNGVGRTG
jgi:hypothetical protein